MSKSTELHGWKAISSYLDVSEKTARKLHNEDGLPVHRVGGRYRADSNEMDQWLRNRTAACQEPKPHSDTQGSPADIKPSKRFLYGLALLLPAALIFSYALSKWTLESTIEAAVFRDGRLELQDGQGQTLRRFPIAGVDASAATPSVAPLIRDVDADGRMEILFNFHPIPHRKEAGRLICFSDTGKALWTFSYAAELSVGEREFIPLFFGHHLRWLQIEGISMVLIVLRHATWYPARAVLLEPSTGTVLAEYRHPGFIEALTLFDFDGDGVDELVLGGVNNPGDGLGHPSLAVLDLPFRTQEGTRHNFFDESNALERSYLLFPRMDFLEAQHVMQVVAELQTAADRLRVTVKAMNQGELHYYLDRDLNVVDLRLSDTSIQQHDAYYDSGPLSHRFHRNELEGWKKVLRLSTAPDGNSPTIETSLQGARTSLRAGPSVETGRIRENAVNHWTE